MMRALRTFALLAFAGSLAAGCGSDGGTAPVTMASIAGTYNLRTYNGIAVPAVLQAANPRIELLSDQVIVKADGTWSETSLVRTTTFTGVTNDTQNSSGSYTLSGAVASFRNASTGVVSTAVFSGTTFEVAQGATRLIYAK